jgi:hypothetical protein
VAVRSSKNTINRALNLALYLLLCVLVGTGVLVRLRLPRGSVRAHARGGRARRHTPDAGGEPLTALGLDRHDWAELRLYAGLAFVAPGAAHLWMNCVWLRKVAASKRAWPLWLGLDARVALAAGIALLPVSR